jgi:hypothetical protein
MVAFGEREPLLARCAGNRQFTLSGSVTHRPPGA